MPQGMKKMNCYQFQFQIRHFSKNIFIVKGSRLCRCHLDEKGFVIEKDLFLVQSFDGEVTFDENSINELIAMYKQS